MGQGISEVLPFAIGIAISPIPIVAIILILFSTRARVNGPVFLAGWVVGLSAAAALVYALSRAASVGSDSTSSDTTSWGKILLGIMLLGLARRSWAKRPKAGEEPALPRWMNSVETISPLRAFELALLLSVVNPKNLALLLGAVGGLAQLDLPTDDAVTALAVFVAVASLSIVIPVAYNLFGGEHARANLDDMKVWLTVHNSAVMAVLFLVFGVVLISRGIGPLSA